MSQIVQDVVDVNRRYAMKALSGIVAASVAGCAGTESTASAPGVNVPIGKSFVALPKLVNAGKAGEFVGELRTGFLPVSIAQGGATTVWTYNAMSSPPLIELIEGEKASITLRNGLDQPTTVHWHGLPVPPSEDGTPFDPVAPGASRVYSFDLPIGSAGTYWYHPHPHTLAHQQVYMGLAGALIVRPKVDPLAAISERVMIITSLRLDANNQIAANRDSDMMDGREGDQLLTNGVKQPIIRVAPGTLERWRMINATNAHYLRLSLSGKTFTVVGHGAQLVERGYSATETLLAPGQRVELLVVAPLEANADLQLTALAYDRGAMMTNTVVTRELLTFGSNSTSQVVVPAIPARLGIVQPLPEATSTQLINLTESMGNMNSMFRINGRVFDMNRVDIQSRLNVVEEWVITNLSEMDHPFHIHGSQFQLVKSNRIDTVPPPGILAWLDTVNLRPNETIRLRIQQTFLGKRLFHCHILEHEDLGMMGVQEVVA